LTHSLIRHSKIMLIPAPVKFRRRRRAMQFGAPPSPPPPPPPALAHVIKVALTPGETTQATWVFDVEVDDPTSALAGLTVNGSGGLSWERDDPLALRVDHGITVSIGQTWQNTAGAGGIVGTNGETLAAGTGQVEP
jgi:hypothetical protein